MIQLLNRPLSPSSCDLRLGAATKPQALAHYNLAQLCSGTRIQAASSVEVFRPDTNQAELQGHLPPSYFSGSRSSRWLRCLSSPGKEGQGPACFPRAECRRGLVARLVKQAGNSPAWLRVSLFSEVRLLKVRVYLRETESILRRQNSVCRGDEQCILRRLEVYLWETNSVF